jgi:6-phosphogluconolactonase
MPDAQVVHVGSNPGGISRLTRDVSTGALQPSGETADVAGVMYLLVHNGCSYAASKEDDGVLVAFDAELKPLGSQPSGGKVPCQLTVDPSGRYLITVNYTSATLAAHPINADGSLGERTDLVQHSGSGPDAGRQEAAHVHDTVFDPAGRFLLMTDLGADRIYTYAFADGHFTEQHVATAPAGAGPRHMAFGADGRLYVADELASTLSWYDYDHGELTYVGSLPSTKVSSSADNFPGEIAAAGDYVYIANRGFDTIGVFRIGDEGPAMVGEVASGGTFVQHFAVGDGYLYAANRDSSTITTFRIDDATGIPAQVGAPLSVPSPVTIVL